MEHAKDALAAILAREAGPGLEVTCHTCSLELGPHAAAAPTRPQTKDGRVHVYRCFDCFEPEYFCAGCVTTFHRHNPFYRVEEWDWEKRFWERRSLGDLGLRIHLGHENGGCCPIQLNTRNMTIVHEHGIGTFPVAFCACRDVETGALSKGEEPIQLISHGLWPASWKKPMTVFTLGALRSHHLLSLQAQISVQDYMTYLTRMTDNVSPENVPVSCSLVRRCSLTHTRA